MNRMVIAPLALVLTLSACNSWDKMVNGEDNRIQSPAPAPAPSPSPSPSPQQIQTFHVYNDALFSNGQATTDPECQLWGPSDLSAGGQRFLQNQQAGATTNLAAEGVQFFRVHSDGDVCNRYMHITYDVNLVGRTVDVSGRRALVFSIRYHRRVLLPGDGVFIFVEDGHGTISEVPLQSAEGLVVGSLTDSSKLDVWQNNIRIPTSAFAGIDWSHVRRGFGLRIGTKVPTDIDDDPVLYNHLSFDVDDIRYEP